MIGPLLRAGLENGFALRDLAIDGLALGEKMGNRFFAVHILAIAQCLEGLHGVPVIGRADNDDVQIRARAQFAVIRVVRARLGLVTASHQLGGRFPAKCTAGGLVAEMGLIRIAHANHLRILFAEERIHYARTTAAGANEPDREAVARGGLGAPKDGGRHDGDRGGILEEAPASEALFFHAVKVP